MTLPLGVTKLVEPPPVDPVAATIQVCEEAIEEGIARILDERWAGYRGHEYEEGYQQGIKDMARKALVGLRGREHITSDDVKRDRKERPSGRSRPPFRP